MKCWFCLEPEIVLSIYNDRVEMECSVCGLCEMYYSD
jgi:hypothetical protein